MTASTRQLVILLIFGMLAQINCVQVYCGLFAMNRKAIAEKACEQKTKDCGGRCFLQKKIAWSQENQPSPDDKTPPAKSRVDLPELMPGLAPDDALMQMFIAGGMLYISDDSSTLPAGHDATIDRPPEHPLHIPTA